MCRHTSEFLLRAVASRVPEQIGRGQDVSWTRKLPCGSSGYEECAKGITSQMARTGILRWRKGRDVLKFSGIDGCGVSFSFKTEDNLLLYFEVVGLLFLALCFISCRQRATVIAPHQWHLGTAGELRVQAHCRERAPDNEDWAVEKPVWASKRIRLTVFSMDMSHLN